MIVFVIANNLSSGCNLLLGGDIYMPGLRYLTVHFHATYWKCL